MTAYGPPNQPGPPSGPPPGGYGPPQGAGGSSAAAPRASSVNPLDWAVLGAGLLALIFSFFSFYTYDAKGPAKAACKASSGDIPGVLKPLCSGDSASAWHGFFGWAGVVLIVLGALAVALAVFMPQVALPVSARLVGAGLAALGTILVLIALFAPPDWPPVSDLITNEDQYNKAVDNGAGFSLYVVLILGLIVTALSFLRFQQTGGALPGRSGVSSSGGFGQSAPGAPGGPGGSAYGAQPGSAAQQQYPPQGPPPQQYPPQGPPQGPPPQQYPPQGSPAGPAAAAVSAAGVAPGPAAAAVPAAGVAPGPAAAASSPATGSNSRATASSRPATASSSRRATNPRRSSSSPQRHHRGRDPQRVPAPARLHHCGRRVRQPGAMGPGEESARRSVVPRQLQASPSRSLWPAAVWTGLGAAVVCATIAIVAVAACWLPVSGSSGRTNSAIRAGLLCFLAALHGGVTVDGVTATWLPLGMTAIVAVAAWRAGSGLADAAEFAGRRDPRRLALAGVAQTASFTVGALVAVPFATLGTSSAPAAGVVLGAVVVFGLSAGAALVRSSALRGCAARLPAACWAVLRAGAVVAAGYLGAGALAAAASLVSHHDRAEALSRALGGGIGGVPVLLLGLLSAPNVAIAGSAYLAGPGFAVGSGTHVGLFGSTHGLLPAFPVLAAVPSGAPNPAVWGLAALTPVVAGLLLTRVALRASGWARRVATAAGGAATAGVLMFLLGWQGGGAVGSARLHTVGASPWQLGAAVAGETLAVGLLALGLAVAWRRVRERGESFDDDLDADDADHADDADDDASFFTTIRVPRLLRVAVDPDTADEPAGRRDDLAG